MRHPLAIVLAACVVASLIVGCGPEVASGPVPSCDVTPATIPLPADCWEDPSCATTTEGDATCGRAYVCEYEQLDGSFYPMCVVVQDCACLDDLEDFCELAVERQARCGR